MEVSPLKRGILILLALLPLPAQAQEKDAHVMQLYNEAAGFYQQEKYSEALSRLQAAYALDERPVLIYNIARCHDKMNHFAEAVQAYSACLQKGADGEMALTAERRIRELAPKARLPGEVEVTSFPGQATVLIDDRPVGFTPCRLPVAPGRHKVTVSKEGFLPITLDVEVASLSRQTLNPRLELEPVRVAPTVGTLMVESNVRTAQVFLGDQNVGAVPYSAEIKPSVITIWVRAEGYEPWYGSAQVEAGKTVKVLGHLARIDSDWTPSPASWALMSVGLAALGAGVVVGGLVPGRMDEANRLWGEARSNDDLTEALEIEGMVRNQALAANILYAAGGAVLVSGILVWLLSPHRAEEAPPLSLRLSPRGAGVEGRF